MLHELNVLVSSKALEILVLQYMIVRHKIIINNSIAVPKTTGSIMQRWLLFSLPPSAGAVSVLDGVGVSVDNTVSIVFL